jgi:hypothetical protein
MKKIVIFALLSLFSFTMMAQQKDIPVSELPKEVKEVLVQYIDILKSAESLDQCADNFVQVAGGGLVNEDGKSLRSSVKPYSLKKDFQNVKFYKDPVEIARVAKSQTKQTGYGASALAGDVYKIYIKKKDDSQPAPIHIVYPKNHSFIKTPKVTNIGSL